MRLFLFLAFPISIIGYIFKQQNYTKKAFIPPVIIGALTGVIVDVIKAFFIFVPQKWTANFALLSLSLFFREAFLPSLILCTIFIFFSKDQWDYRCVSFVPLLGSYFAITLPYSVAASASDGTCLFLLFVKPVIMVSMVIAAGCLLRYINNSSGKKAYLLIILTLILMFIPSLAETLWRQGFSAFTWLSLSIIYALSCFVFYLKYKKDNTRIPLFMSM